MVDRFDSELRVVRKHLHDVEDEKAELLTRHQELQVPQSGRRGSAGRSWGKLKK